MKKEKSLAYKEKSIWFNSWINPILGPFIIITLIIALGYIFISHWHIIMIIPLIVCTLYAIAYWYFKDWNVKITRIGRKLV